MVNTSQLEAISGTPIFIFIGRISVQPISPYEPRNGFSINEY